METSNIQKLEAFRAEQANFKAKKEQVKKQMNRYICEFNNIHTVYANEFKQYLETIQDKLNFNPILNNEKISKKLQDVLDLYRKNNGTIIESIYLKCRYKRIYLCLRNCIVVGTYEENTRNVIYVDTETNIYYADKFNFEQDAKRYDSEACEQSIEQIKELNEQIEKIKSRIKDISEYIPEQVYINY